jgi:hypothetical protein
MSFFGEVIAARESQIPAALRSKADRAIRRNTAGSDVELLRARATEIVRAAHVPIVVCAWAAGAGFAAALTGFLSEAPAATVTGTVVAAIFGLEALWIASWRASAQRSLTRASTSSHPRDEKVSGRRNPAWSLVGAGVLSAVALVALGVVDGSVVLIALGAATTLVSVATACLIRRSS